jgi:hypothetical protein
MTYNPRMNQAGPAPESNTFSDDGVDLTLIRWLLSLTPAERLAVLQSNMQSLEPLRGAADRR